MRKLFLCLLVFPALVFASETDTFNRFQFSGYVDTSYQYLVRNHQFISGVNDRVNDLAQNGFTLQQAAFSIASQPKEGWGGLITGVVGRDTYALAPYGWNPYYGSQTLGFFMPQAFTQYATGPVTLVGGLFTTLIGEESYNSNMDANFSRSILDGYAEPGPLMGVRGFYKLNNKWEFNLGLNNGWSGIRDTSRGPSIEYGVTYIIDSFFTLYAQGLSGEQRLLTKTAHGPMGRRNIINVIGEVNATSKLLLALSGDYAVQSKSLTSDGSIGRASWQGVSGYVNYQWAERWRTSVRGEIYDDQNGYTTKVKQNWRELTLTLAFVPIKEVELRAETRHDFSSANSFMNADSAGASNNQQSYALEALYRF